MAEEVMGLTGSFSVDTSSLDAGSSQVAAAAQKITQAMKETKAATDQTKVASEGVAVAFGKLNGSASAWTNVVSQANATTKQSMASQKAYEKSLGDTLVPLQKLQVEGLKYQEVLRKIGDAQAAAAARQAASAAQAAIPGGGTFVPLQKLQLQAIEFSKATEKGSSGATNLAAKLMVLGQVADDAQYGFRAIVNQIPMAVMAFGGTMGLAGGIALAGVAINQLINHWDDLAKLMGTPVLKTKAQEMEELAKATERTAVEQDKLNRYTREQKTAEEQRKRRPEQEGVIQNQVGKAIGEFGADELYLQIRRKMESSLPQVSDAQVNKQLGRFGSPEFANDPDIAASRRKIRADLEKRRQDSLNEAARALLANAESAPGKEGEAARERLAGMLPGAAGDIFRDATDSGRAATLRRQSISESMEEAAQMRAMEDEFGPATDKTKKDREYRLNLIESERDDAKENEENFKQYIDRKIANDEELTFGERKAASPEQLKRSDEGKDKLFDEEAKLAERDSDLNWKLRGLLMRSATESRSFGDADSYEASIKATSEEAQLKKLHDINEVLKQIAVNTQGREKVAERIAR